MRRRRSREVVVQALYSLEKRSQPFLSSLPPAFLEEYFTHFYHKESVDIAFVQELLFGVLREYEHFESIVEAQSEHWRFKRIACVDKNILRVGIYELSHCKDIPISVTINEAVEIANRLGSKDSGSFINGILDKISKTCSSKNTLNI